MIKQWCEECRGEGGWKYRNGNCQSDIEESDCPECDGKGYIEKDPFAELKSFLDQEEEWRTLLISENRSALSLIGKIRKAIKFTDSNGIVEAQNVSIIAGGSGQG